MKEQIVSNSAGIIAAHRAIDASKPGNERICYDPFAAKLLPPGFTVVGEHDLSDEIALELFRGMVPGFHEFFLARTRYIDESLQNHINEGLEQLVILGAGYDSRAYRFDELKENVKVFELDHPATQDFKKEKLCELFQDLPDHVTFIPIDFLKKDLATSLLENGYDNTLKTFFIWEGVTMYIDLEAVNETLSFISGNAGKESAVIFDYTYANVIDGKSSLKEAIEWLKLASKSDEPLLFGLEENNVESFLTERGFGQIECITNEYFKEHYFTGNKKDMESTPIFALVHAVVEN